MFWRIRGACGGCGNLAGTLDVKHNVLYIVTYSPDDLVKRKPNIFYPSAKLEACRASSLADFLFERKRHAEIEKKFFRVLECSLDSEDCQSA